MFHYFLDIFKRNIDSVRPFFLFQHKKVAVYGYVIATVTAILVQIVERYISMVYPQAPYLVGVALRKRGVVVVIVATCGEAE